MWIIQEPKKVALWNKQHFEEKNGECVACLKYSVLIVVEKIYIKWNIWRVAVRPSYTYDARFLKVNCCFHQSLSVIPISHNYSNWVICSVLFEKLTLCMRNFNSILIYGTTSQSWASYTDWHLAWFNRKSITLITAVVCMRLSSRQWVSFRFQDNI
jgi:hypothetical protein